MSERRAPVQADTSRTKPTGALGEVPGTVPWDVHVLAWEGYAAAGHGAQSAERMAERAGFSYRELQCALAGHYNDCYHCTEQHEPVPGWTPTPPRDCGCDWADGFLCNYHRIYPWSHQWTGGRP